MTTTHIQVPDEVYRDSGAQTSVQRMFVRNGYLARLAAHNPTAWGGVLAEVAAERVRQEAKFPEQHLPDGTNELHGATAEFWKIRTGNAAADGTLTWKHVLAEEFHEALAETAPARLRAELIQVAAVAARWVEDIDRRAAVNALCGECGKDGIVFVGHGSCRGCSGYPGIEHEPTCGLEPCPNGCWDRLNKARAEQAASEGEVAAR